MWAPKIMTSRHQESGSFKRPGAVYSVWLFGVSESSSTSWNRLRSFGVPGTAAPVSVDVLRSLQSMSNHQWSHVCSVYPVKTWDLTASDSWWVPAFSTRCCGPSCRDHTDNIVRPPPDLLRHWCQKWDSIHVCGGRVWCVIGAGDSL